MECFSARKPSQMAARYIYAFIFLCSTVIAWIARDYGGEGIRRLHYFIACKGEHECLATESVLRISLGCFAFFLIMFVTTVGTSRTQSMRDNWHSSWWSVKLPLWVLLLVLPFFVPPKAIKVYGEVARFGAGAFLIVQVLSVVNFIHWWNERWLQRQYWLLLSVVSFICYGVAVAGISFMYVWFAPRPSCSLNIFFITWTLVFLIVMTGISLHPKVNASLMTSSLVCLYAAFLCWSAIMSEPKSVTCNTRPRQTGKGDTVTVLSFVLGLAAIVFATFSTGADTNPFAPVTEASLQPDDKRVPYAYGFFHFVFAVGSMYFAMLLVGWNVHQTMQKWSIDVGWLSVWVKITNQWFAAAYFVWTLFHHARKAPSGSTM